MLFKDVIGQEAIKQHLIELVKHNRLSHALLFLGKEGSGALPLALAFCEWVVCQPANNGATPLFNNTIESEFILPNDIQSQPAFHRAVQLQHPDLHFSYPVILRKSGEKPISIDFIKEWREFVKQNPYGNVYDWLQFIGAENKQGNITAEECNEIIRKLSLKSFESDYKILLLWMPEYLGKEGNKLLKLIEEPPPNTLFVLVAENETEILPTIRSRCQLVKVPLLEDVDIVQALVERADVSVDKANQLSVLCEGNYHEALALYQHADADWQSLLRDWMNAILRGGPIAQVKFINAINELGREKQKHFFRYFEYLLEKSIRTEGGNAISLSGENDFVTKLNRLASVEQRIAIIQEIENATYYVERNANAKMLFHALSIKIFHIIRNNEVVVFF